MTDDSVTKAPQAEEHPLVPFALLAAFALAGFALRALFFRKHWLGSEETK